MAVILMLIVGVFFAIRFIKKKKAKEPEYSNFEEDFKELYGTTWDSWVTVKRDLLTDDSAFINSIKSIFNDMYIQAKKKAGEKK